MSRSDNIMAASQFKSFNSQTIFLAEQLLKYSSFNCSISLETIGDVGFEGEENKIIELKNADSKNHNPLSNSSLDLWKTIFNWAMFFYENKEKNIEQYKLQLLVFTENNGGKEIAEKMNNCYTEEQFNEIENDIITLILKKQPRRRCNLQTIKDEYNFEKTKARYYIMCLFSKELYPYFKKIIIIVPAIILILIASFLKSGVNSVFDLITVTSGDAYFAGPVSVNNAIGLAKSCSVGITNIIYDFFNNMPIVNHFIKSGNSTVYLYNLYLGRIFSNSSGDQIIPLVGQSYIFFGWILSPLLSVVSIILMRIADKQFFYATNYMKYVWAFISIWFGLETILNMTINLSWIYIRIIPLFITFWFIEKISYKQKIEKRM